MATNDYTRQFQDALSNMPVDTSAVREALKTQAALGERLTRVALQAAEQSTEISARWTKDTIARLGELASAKDQPADYAKALTDFASAASELAAEHVAAYAEVAKKVQLETVDLMLTAGKDIAEDAQSTAKTVAENVGRQTETLTRNAKDALKNVTEAPKA